MNQYLYSVIVLVLTFVFAYIFRKVYGRFIARNATLIKNDPTNYRFVGYVLSSVIYIMGIGFAINLIPELKAVSNSLLAGAGILAAAVGFAAQSALSNVISGFFVIIFKPYRINDRIILENQLEGVVEDITLRHTVIRNYENQRIIVPNNRMGEKIIINSDFEDARIKRWVEFDISYDADIDLARKIITQEVEKHHLFVDGRSGLEKKKDSPKVPVKVIALGDTSIRLRAWVWAKEHDFAFLLKCDLLESVKKRFDAEGIEIPYPYQNIILKGQDGRTMRQED